MVTQSRLFENQKLLEGYDATKIGDHPLVLRRIMTYRFGKTAWIVILTLATALCVLQMPTRKNISPETIHLISMKWKCFKSASKHWTLESTLHLLIKYWPHISVDPTNSGIKDKSFLALTVEKCYSC